MKMRHRRRLRVIAVALVVVGTAAYGWHRYRYPYGGSHRCIKSLYVGLVTYAQSHDEQFPVSVKGSAESLALLIPDHAIIETVCGKTVSADAATRYYQRHGSLREDLCGWEYQPGLKLNDSARIAILWDKVPLGHNGQRTKNRTREVIFLDGRLEAIPASEWAGFLEEQAALLMERGIRGG